MTTKMIRELKTASEIIDALGGTAEVARLTKRGMAAVSNWRASGRLPAEFFLIMTQQLTEKFCSAPSSLWSIREPIEREATA